MSARAMNAPPLVRERIVAVARRWIGTPYLHQASVEGAGCDCLGLVRGLWRELVGPEPEPPPPYTPDWAERAGRETLAEAAGRHMRPVAREAARPGDVLLFRLSASAPAKHCAILATDDTIVHAYWGQAVTETPLGPWWRRRRAAAFAFPGVVD
jgi:NlpC/P60 family putative phage cell wall peptidase